MGFRGSRVQIRASRYSKRLEGNEIAKPEAKDASGFCFPGQHRVNTRGASVSSDLVEVCAIAAVLVTGYEAGRFALVTSRSEPGVPLDNLGDAALPCSHKVSWGAVADNSAEDLDLLQGTLDVLILKTLSWGPRRGYAIAR